jgi:hypothetical protein
MAMDKVKSQKMREHATILRSLQLLIDVNRAATAAQIPPLFFVPGIGPEKRTFRPALPQNPVLFRRENPPPLLIGLLNRKNPVLFAAGIHF